MNYDDALTMKDADDGISRAHGHLISCAKDYTDALLNRVRSAHDPRLDESEKQVANASDRLQNAMDQFSESARLHNKAHKSQVEKTKLVRNNKDGPVMSLSASDGNAGNRTLDEIRGKRHSTHCI